MACCGVSAEAGTIITFWYSMGDTNDEAPANMAEQINMSIEDYKLLNE